MAKIFLHVRSPSWKRRWKILVPRIPVVGDYIVLPVGYANVETVVLPRVESEDADVVIYVFAVYDGEVPQAASFADAIEEDISLWVKQE